MPLPKPLEGFLQSLRDVPWQDVAWSLGVLVGAVLAALLVARLLSGSVERWVKDTDSKLDDAIVQLLRRPIRWLLSLGAVAITRPIAVLPPSVDGFLRGVLVITLIAAAAWLLIRAIRVFEAVVEHRFSIDADDNLHARSVQTQVHSFGNIARFVVALLGVCFILMTFEAVRQVGVSLLASAGVAGVVIGFAAQRSIATLVAGVQIALTQPIRVDDVVVVEGEWGRIEEIRLTYVVVRIWDLRRLVVPITYFIEKPFHNWTRTSADLLGVVPLPVDYSLPIDDTRAELERILKESEHWDGETWGLQVTEATERTMLIRPLFSAADSSAQWNLRCEVREKLIGWIQRHHPDCLPRLRADFERPARAA